MGTYPFPSLPCSFFKKIQAETISMPVNNALNKQAVYQIFNDYEIKGNYVLLTGTAVQDHWYAEEVYTTFINQIIDMLGRDKVLSKCHPRYKELYGKEKELTQIPSFIPGNILIDNFDFFIGIESTLLVEAAKAGKIAISIIDWLRPNEQLYKVQHDFFDNRLQGQGIIYYPKTMADLKEILNMKS